MKATFLLFLAALFSGTTFAQFQATQDFELVGTNSYRTINFDSLGHVPLEDLNPPVVVLHQEETGKCIEVIEILDYEMFDTAYVETFKNPGLKNVQEVLRVELVFYACCAWVESYYFVHTKDDRIVALPQLQETVECDGDHTEEMPKYLYQFPDQEFGLKNKIIAGQYYWMGDQMQTTSLTDTLVVAHTYAWTGNTLKME